MSVAEDLLSQAYQSNMDPNNELYWTQEDDGWINDTDDNSDLGDDIEEIEAALYSQIYFAPAPTDHQEDVHQRTDACLQQDLTSGSGSHDAEKIIRDNLMSKDSLSDNKAEKCTINSPKTFKRSTKHKPLEPHTGKPSKLKKFLSAVPDGEGTGNENKKKEKQKHAGKVIVVSDEDAKNPAGSKNPPVITIDSDDDSGSVLSIDSDHSDANSDGFGGSGGTHKLSYTVDIKTNLQGANHISTSSNTGTADISDMTLEEIHDHMGDGDWRVLDADMGLVSSGATSNRRYYSPQTNIQCYNCKRRGHLSKHCPEEKRTVCYLCGDNDHLSYTCPNVMCRNCFASGHRVMECNQARRSQNINCYRCAIFGHLIYDCTEIWRMYHITTEETRIKTPRKGTGSVNPKQYCYNCGKKGHFGHECQAKRMRDNKLITSPFVSSYSTYIPKRPAAQEPTRRRFDDTPTNGRVKSKRKRAVDEDGPVSKRRRIDDKFIREPKTTFNGNVSSDCDEDPTIHWRAKKKNPRTKKGKSVHRVNSDKIIDQEEQEYKASIKKRRPQKKKQKAVQRPQNKAENRQSNNKHYEGSKAARKSKEKAQRARAVNNPKGRGANVMNVRFQSAKGFVARKSYRR